MNADKPSLSDLERIHVVLEEYRALNALLLTRIKAVDERLPLVGGLSAAVVGSLAQLPGDLRLMILLAAPALLVWLFETAVAHTRSKEDELRRLDEIESHVNRLAREELLVFQSRHPNQKAMVGGRSGQSTVRATLSLCVVSLVACAALFAREARGTVWLVPYAAYLLVAVADFVRTYQGLRHYRYQKAASDQPPSQKLPSRS
ncbi:MAG: hypothetical protein FLDDKLPJ_03329 [Phycisphaerae bacterium]|nr:hypothetical protein [Phycisphaerae bacterium]